MEKPNRYLGHKTLRTDRLEVLPQFDIELEKAVLYCLLYSGEARGIAESINEEDFYNGSNKKLFKELKSHFKDEDFNVITIPAKIKKSEAYLRLFGENYLLSYFDIYLSQLKILTAKRKLENICYKTTVKIREGGELFEIKNKVIKQIKDIKTEMDKNIVDVKEVDLGLEEYYKNINKKIIKTGFSKLDAYVKGFQKGSFCVIGGVPAVGKTTFALNMVNSICREKYNVLFVSLEMPYREVEGKLISEMTGISTNRIRITEDEKDEQIINKIIMAREKIYDYSLYFIGMEGVYTYEIDEVIKNIGNIDIVFIDYLQRIKVSGGANRYEKISSISSDIKTIALKYDIPIVVIVSVNRAYADRASKEPMLSDLRDSGNIEFDADMVLLLYRRAQFDDEISKEESKLIIAKNRYGISNITIDLVFKPERSKFFIKEIQKDKKERKDVFD